MSRHWAIEMALLVIINGFLERIMRNINIGDAVCIIEVWKDATGILVPEQTIKDCRFYGFCRDITPEGILVTPEMEDDIEIGIIFPSLIVTGMKEGDSIVMHADDATELFPVVETESASAGITDACEDR
jgi:bifunctional DNA-binding transcriptional regulator/antitoxin component of YhaV-PrlF toxin-antitoxin module